MSSGIVFGLTAALCWGVADFSARSASRAGGIFRTLLYMEIIATAALLAVAMPLGLLDLSHLSSYDPARLLVLVLVAVLLNLIILAGTALLYRAFAIGTLAIVSPIAASYAAVTALLALLLSGEQIRRPHLLGIACALGGVILTSALSRQAAPDLSEKPPDDASRADEPSASLSWVTTEEIVTEEITAAGIAIETITTVKIATDAAGPDESDTKSKKAPHSRAPGLIEALLAMFFFGFAYWALRFVVADLGGVTVVFIGKVSDLLALLLLALLILPARIVRTLRSTHPLAPAPQSAQRGPSLSRPFLIAIIPTALCDTAANIAYNLGIVHSLTSVVAVLSSLFSAVTVLLAWILLRDRLTRWQWVGIIAIFLGIALVSM